MRRRAVRCQPQYARPVARKRTTIRELAEYTGLSPAAVSYALRGMRVSAETERRVREAAERLGYEADPIARALAGGATGVVGLLVGSLADFWNQELVRAVQRELYSAELSTLVADADGEPARERRLGVDRPSGADGHHRRRAARRKPGGRGRVRQRARRAADPPPPQRPRPSSDHRALVGCGDLAGPPGRARGRPLRGLARAR